jgi:hypothetical protein
MSMLIGLLATVVGIASFICFIVVVVKQFQDAGPIHGIIGIITCGIWALIWGWMNADRLGIKNLMLTWTGLIVLSILLQFMGGAALIMGA